MVVKKSSTKPEPEVAADVSTDREQEQAVVENVAYRYVGGLDGVLVVVDGNAYEAQRGGVVVMPRTDAMDRHSDFKRVALPESEE